MKKTPVNFNVIIVGSGPSALGAAFELLENNEKNWEYKKYDRNS
jgi:ribulose 1,5-bisphosphate synthetase/thiazole synthase